MYLHTLTVTLLLALGSTSTLGLLCGGIRSPSDEVRRATAVFSGEAISQKFVESKDESARELGGGALVTKFKVTRWWKGGAAEEITIHTSAQRIDGGISMLAEVVRFEVGEAYLVYAFGPTEELRNGLCSRTARSEGAEEDLRHLGKGYAPRTSSLSLPTAKPNNGMHPTPRHAASHVP